MRLDPTKDESFQRSPQWENGDLVMQVILRRNENDPSQGFVARSFSGNERNRLFLQRDNNFTDVSLVSGADFREDARGFALLDFDRDGALDMAVMSPHAPRFRLFKNHFRRNDSPSNAIFINLVGGNDQPVAQDQWSAREAYGAKLIATIGDRVQAYQFSCGEGLSSQNSRWLHVGMGTAEKIDRLEIYWPSGKQTTRLDILAGERVILLENE